MENTHLKTIITQQQGHVQNMRRSPLRRYFLLDCTVRRHHAPFSDQMAPSSLSIDSVPTAERTRCSTLCLLNQLWWRSSSVWRRQRLCCCAQPRDRQFVSRPSPRPSVPTTRASWLPSSSVTCRASSRCAWRWPRSLWSPLTFSSTVSCVSPQVLQGLVADERCWLPCWWSLSP